MRKATMLFLRYHKTYMAASGAGPSRSPRGGEHPLPGRPLRDGITMYEYIRVVMNRAPIDLDHDPPPGGGNKILDIIEFEMIGKIDLNE